jgi:tRNA pseudouridine38-40 synthase
VAGPARSRREAARPGAHRSIATYRVVVEYDGTDFHGFQFQPGARTIAGEIERALGELFRETIKITGAGRTDAGVHATGQVISFASDRDFPADRLAIALNSVLPPDVSAREAALVDEGFSARFSARARTYEYVIKHRPMRSAVTARYAVHVYRKLDRARFERAARDLVGEHDFVSFCAIAPQNGRTIRTIHRIDVDQRGDLLRVRITGDGFLHHMVRNCVGTLLEVAAGDREVDAIPAILAARSRSAAGKTAPACGLFLCGVRYDDFDSYGPAVGFPD